MLEQVDRRGADAARRGRPAEDHGVDALGQEDRGEVRAEEARRALLQHNGLVVAGVEPRVDLDPWPVELELGERRRLLYPEAAVAQMRLEPDGRVDDRVALRPRRVEEPPRGLDLGAEVGAEYALRVGEPAGEVDDEDAGPLTPGERLPEPRLPVDLACLLVGHA